MTAPRKNILPFNSLTYRIYCAVVIGYWGGLLGFDARYHGSPALLELKHDMGIPWYAFGVCAIVAALLLVGPPALRIVGWSLCLVVFIVLMYAIERFGWTHPDANLNGGTMAALAVAIGASVVGIWNASRLLLIPADLDDETDPSRLVTE